MKALARKFAIVFVFVCLFATGALAVACGDDDGGKNTVTITYDTGADASKVSALTAEPGSKIYPPADPTRDGYRFDGWEKDGVRYEFDVMPDKSITLTAAWKKLYTVTFVTGEGASAIEAAQYAEGDELNLTEKPTLNGYKFVGWKDGDALFTETVMPARNLTLTAEWKAAYTITFDTGVSGITANPLVEEAGAAIAPPIISRPGWHVAEWQHNGMPYKFDKMPSENITLTAVWKELTNLPSMFIELYKEDGSKNPLHDVELDKDTYVSSRITLTNTDDEFALNYLKAEFKGRGNGSWNDIPEVAGLGKKRGYRLKFDKKQSLFGRAANKHWVVIACANFNDPTMSRNYLAYNMAGEVFGNIEYATEAHWIDLYINNEYRGVYLLCEHVRVDKGRVEIESEFGVDDTGYFVEYDAYAQNEGEEGVNWFRVDGLKYPFTVKAPNPDDYLEEGISKARFMKQVAFIKNEIEKLYNAALDKDFDAFSAYADVNSFVDMYILHELFKNVDTGYSSFFLYKKAGGKIFAGPPWDFDATTGFDASYERGDRTPQGIYVAGSIAEVNGGQCASELYISLYQTSGFKNAVKARWKKLSPQISEFLDRRMNDDVYETYKAAMGKNYAAWEQKSQTAAENDWLANMRELKQWLTDRITWLDGEWA